MEEVVTQPSQVTPNTPVQQAKGRNTKPMIIIGIACIVIFILLNVFGILSILPFSLSTKKPVAELNGEKIYSNEVDAVSGILAKNEKKEKDNPDIQKKATDFVIEYRLLDEEAKKRGIEHDVEKLVDKRLTASITQYGSEKALVESLSTSIDAYESYLRFQATKELLEPLETQWKVIDYFSIRYLYDDNASEKERAYKQVVDKKITEYYEKMQNGLPVREAIKERCQDNEINFLPYDTANKIYKTTFNGVICREQQINLKVSKDTNPVWGEAWLKEVFDKTKKGQLSPIIDFKGENIGMYFVIDVLDEGNGNAFSVDELLQDLKKKSEIKTY